MRTTYVILQLTADTIEQMPCKDVKACLKGALGILVWSREAKDAAAKEKSAACLASLTTALVASCAPCDDSKLASSIDELVRVVDGVLPPPASMDQEATQALHAPAAMRFRTLL